MGSLHVREVDKIIGYRPLDHLSHRSLLLTAAAGSSRRVLTAARPCAPRRLRSLMRMVLPD